MMIKRFISILNRKGYYYEMEGNTEDVNPNRLLNTMIKQGIFE